MSSSRVDGLFGPKLCSRNIAATRKETRHDTEIGEGERVRTSPVSRSTLISAAATSSEGLVITLSLSRRRELARAAFKIDIRGHRMRLRNAHWA